MSSLSSRLLLAVSLLLLVFFGATIVVLDSAFREAGEEAQRNILDGQLIALLAAADPGPDGSLEMPAVMAEPRLGTIGSGLYAELRENGDDIVWRSESSLTLDIPFGPAPPPGPPRFSELTLDDGTPLMALAISVEWELPGGELRPYSFHVAESLDSFNAQLAAFRRQLFSWFAAVALIMLLSISFVLRYLLSPLRQIEDEITQIEDGRRESLSQGLPTELEGVARNMNLLIGSERGRAERYRQTLDNLAHSLKTPLAAIRAVLSESSKDDSTERIEAQIERMNDIVRYQLRKPAALVSDGFGVGQVDIGTQLDRLVDGLSKVYKDKSPQIRVAVDRSARFQGETGDFLEIAGNLVDNACKWCKSQVTVSVAPLDGRGMLLSVADDGPGIPEEARELLLRRGMRLDESAPGHGIGLAVVKDIVAAQRGTMQIGRSDLGGAEIRVAIPGS
ncbi:MAG: ATP-binding protein [Woeseiaceae bacterium]|nr:ATP-binding protein [Woeseiaceae bacterium]